MTMTSSTANAYIGTGIVSTYDPGAVEIKFWAASTAYSLNDLVLNFDPAAADGVLPIKLYKCITAGTSAGSGGPTGVTSDITDGTAHWEYQSYEDRGDCEDFSIDGESEEKELNWHRGGVVTIARIDEMRRKQTLKVTLKEFTVENIAILGMGTIVGTSPNRMVKLGSGSRPTLLWNFEGKNDFGNKFQVVVPRLKLNVANSLGFLSEDYAKLETSGVLNALSDGNYYYMAEL